MIDAKVYLVETDTNTVGHCGHEIKKGESYYMLRTNVPKWVTLCPSCVALLSSPVRVKVADLVHKFEFERKFIVNAKDTRRKAIQKTAKKREFKAEMDMREAEWV